MDLKKISKVQNDLELGADHLPSENTSAGIKKSANAEKCSLDCEPSRHLSQEQQQQPEDHPTANRKCFNEHLNEVPGAAINENISSITSDEMHPPHQTFPLNDGRPVIDVETGLQTMNEDCLREICQYLNLFDIVRLGQTCMHLESFAQRVIFPKKVKLIEIENRQWDGFTIKLNRKYSLKSLPVLTNAIKYLGRFVEDFKFFNGFVYVNSDVWRSIVHVMLHCKHLKTLTIGYVSFHSNQVQEFQGLIGSLTSLKVLNLRGCSGLISNWSANIKQNLTIEKLSIQTSSEMKINDHFLEYFKNLSSLDLMAYDKSCSLSRILNHFGHSLRRLKLNSWYGYQSIAPIISKNLTNLEHLEVTFWNEKYFIHLPHMKSVRLRFSSKSTNTVLRKLSEHGMIETLELSACKFTSEGTNDPPLIFNKLQTLNFGPNSDSSTFIAMANALMPALHTVEITSYSEGVFFGLFKFVQSNKTIKTIHLKLFGHEFRMASIVQPVIPFEFWSQLIDILREPCAPNREFIHLSIFSGPVIEKQSWKLLKDNRHLLKVEQERECFPIKF